MLDNLTGQNKLVLSLLMGAFSTHQGDDYDRPSISPHCTASCRLPTTVTWLKTINILSLAAAQVKELCFVCLFIVCLNLLLLAGTVQWWKCSPSPPPPPLPTNVTRVRFRLSLFLVLLFNCPASPFSLPPQIPNSPNSRCGFLCKYSNLFYYTTMATGEARSLWPKNVSKYFFSIVTLLHNTRKIKTNEIIKCLHVIRVLQIDLHTNGDKSQQHWQS